jgi:hypothetical protein
MEARKLLSLVLVVAGLLASPVVAVVIGACERRAAVGRRLTEKTAARMMMAAAVGSVALVSVGIALTIG